MDLEIGHALYALRIAFLLGIALMVAVVYKAPKDPQKHDWWASSLASFLAGISLGWATANIITWDPSGANVREAFATSFVGIIFMLTVWSRGNVAKMIPGRSWR